MFTKSRRGIYTSTACLLKNEPTSYTVQQAKRNKAVEPIAKASVNSAKLMLYGIDPKPDELPMSRVKFIER